jgi:hypothetical protein
MELLQDTRFSQWHLDVHLFQSTNGNKKAEVSQLCKKDKKVKPAAVVNYSNKPHMEKSGHTMDYFSFQRKTIKQRKKVLSPMNQ